MPAGCFILGAPRDAPSAASRNDEEVEVRLTHSFLIGQTEVTREEWLARGMHEPLVDWRVAGSTFADVPPAGYASCTDRRCPVVWTSFEDAAAFANARSAAEGFPPCYALSDCVREPGANMRCRSVRITAASPYACTGYRLPTEAEWEYAARAGTRSDFPSGAMKSNPEITDGCDRDRALDAIGWYCGNSGAPSGAQGGRPHPVALKKPNAFGLYDTAGNAYEWTNDLYLPRGYGPGPLTDPLFGVSQANDLTPARHPDYGEAHAPDGFTEYRVYRGGAFDLWPVLSASGRRSYMAGATQHTGLRLVRSLAACDSESACARAPWAEHVAR